MREARRKEKTGDLVAATGKNLSLSLSLCALAPSGHCDPVEGVLNGRRRVFPPATIRNCFVPCVCVCVCVFSQPCSRCRVFFFFLRPSSPLCVWAITESEAKEEGRIRASTTHTYTHTHNIYIRGEKLQRRAPFGRHSGLDMAGASFQQGTPATLS